MPQFLINANEAIMSRHPYVELNELAKGYVEAMFFTNCDSGDDNKNRANELGVDALTHDSIDAIAGYCAEFKATAIDALEIAYASGFEPVQAGRDLWLDAQGHGCGFVDRTELDEDNRDELAKAAQSMAEKYVEIGDDDRIYYR